jgi:hypothetical protein
MKISAYLGQIKYSLYSISFIALELVPELRNWNFLTSRTVTCKVGTITVIDYGSGTGTRYEIIYFISLI